MLAAIQSGNAFANANKCLDHILACGASWQEMPAPLLHDGQPVPLRHLAFARQALVERGWSVDEGYLKP